MQRSGQKLLWTGRAFVCKVCKVMRGPTTIRAWMAQGECPGSSALTAHRKAVRGGQVCRLREGSAYAQLTEVLKTVIAEDGGFTTHGAKITENTG